MNALARTIAIAALLMTATTDIRPHLAFAKDLDFSVERDVRYAVDGYVERVGEMFDRYHFDREHAVAAVLWFPRYARLTKGAGFAGAPFVLSDWQALDIIVPVWGWKCADGTRRYRRGEIWVPRKNGKTELMAGVALLHLGGDGEYGGEGYAVATKEDQARIVHDAARRMVLMNPHLQSDFGMQVFKDSVYCEPLFAAFRPLGGKAEGSHGKGPSYRIADELHEFKDDRLLQFLDQGTGARQQPMAWDISTAGLQQGYGWELWNVCRNLAAGTIVDHRTLVAIYAADEDDDPYDPATWAKANPNLGVSLKLDYMRDQAELARRSSRHENDFKRYHLNMWVGQLRRWLKMDLWDKCARGGPDAWKSRAEELRGRKCLIGIDLASTTDLCAKALLFPPDGGDDRWSLLMSFYVPRDGIEDRIRHERVPYDIWEHEGAIAVTDGNAADHDAIERDIRADFEMFDVISCGFDPWNAHAIMASLTADFGDRVVKVPQTMAVLSGPSKTLERWVLTGRLDHAAHPVLRWMAANVATVTDGNGNIKTSKDKSTQKIDGIVASIIAIALTNGEEPNDGLPTLEAMIAL